MWSVMWQWNIQLPARSAVQLSSFGFARPERMRHLIVRVRLIQPIVKAVKVHRMVHRRRVEDGPTHGLRALVREPFRRGERTAVDRFEQVDEVRRAVDESHGRVHPEHEDVIDARGVRLIDDDRAREFGIAEHARVDRLARVVAVPAGVVASVVAERARPIEHERDRPRLRVLHAHDGGCRIRRCGEAAYVERMAEFVVNRRDDARADGHAHERPRNLQRLPASPKASIGRPVVPGRRDTTCRGARRDSDGGRRPRGGRPAPCYRWPRCRRPASARSAPHAGGTPVRGRRRLGRLRQRRSGRLGERVGEHSACLEYTIPPCRLRAGPHATPDQWW